MYDGTFGQDSPCSELGLFKGTRETVMNICATYHVATLLSDLGPMRFITSSLYREVIKSLRNVCLSTCNEWRTVEAFVVEVLHFVRKSVSVTTKYSAPSLVAAQRLKFQIMGDKIKGILRVITEYCVRVL